MAILATSIGRVKDWKAFEKMDKELLTPRAKAHGCTYQRVYRSLNDPNQYFWMAEFPSHDEFHKLGDEVGDRFNELIVGGESDDNAWEVTNIGRI